MVYFGAMTKDARTHQALSPLVELFRFEGEGNLVVLQLREVDRDPGGRGGQFLGTIVVESGFVSGSIPIYVGVPEDLTAWQEVLDHLDAGHEAHWMKDKRSAEVLIRWDGDDRFEVTVRDRLSSLTDVTVTVAASEEWFDQAYDRLDRVYDLGERSLEQNQRPNMEPDPVRNHA